MAVNGSRGVVPGCRWHWYAVVMGRSVWRILIGGLKTLVGILAGVALLAVVGIAFVSTEAGRDWMAGHLSLYSGQDVAISGKATLNVTTPGIVFRDVTIAEPGSQAWLSIARISVSAPRGIWPPTESDPLVLQVSGATLDPAHLPLTRESDEPPALHLPPYAITLQVRDFSVPGQGMRPEFLLSNGGVDFDPRGELVASVEAMLGDQPLTSRLTLGVDAKASGARTLSVDGVADYFGLVLVATGNIEDYLALRGIDIELAAGGDVGAHAEVASKFTQQNVKGHLTGDWGAMQLDLEQLEAVTANGRIRSSAQIRQLAEGAVMERGDLSLRADDVGLFLADFGVETGVSLSLAMDAEIRGDRQGLSVDRLELSLGDDVLGVLAKGRLNRLDSGSGRFELKDGEVSLQLTDAESLMEQFGQESVVKGDLAGRILLSGRPESLQVDGLSLDLGQGALLLNGTGTVQLTEGGPKAMLELASKGEAIARVLPHVPMPEWLGEQGAASATLHYADSVFSLVDIESTFNSRQGHASVRGNISDMASLTADGIHVVLEPFTGTESGGSLHSLDLRADLPDGIDGKASLVAEGLLSTGEFEFEGSIGDLRGLAGIAGRFVFQPRPGEVTIPVAMDAHPVLEGEISVADLHTGRFNLTASIRGGTGSFSYAGVLGQDEEGSGRLMVEGMDPNVLAAMVGASTDFPHVLDLHAMVAHSPRGVTLTDLSLTTGESRLDGRLSLDYATDEGENLKLAVDARSPRLVLADFGLDGGPEDETRYFSTEPLDLERLRGIDLDLRLEVERLLSDALDYTDVDLIGNSRKGVLTVSSRQQLLGGGGSTMDIAVDVRGQRPVAGIRLELQGIDPGQLRTVKDSGESYSGDVDVEFDIKGAGESAQEILSNADGHFLVRINHAVIPNRKLDLLSADFLFETLRMVNPFVRQASEMEIECGIVGFIVRDGRAFADKTVVIKGRRLLIVGEGEIDLGSEKLSMVVRPKAQEGIGLNTSGLVKFIGIGGTLMNPEVRTDARGLLMSGASLGAAVASGGMSLFLQNMFDRVTSGTRECERTEAIFRDQMNNPPEQKKSPRRRHPGAR
jgi:hypothetical protein